MNILKIDTTDTKNVNAKLLIDGMEYESKSESKDRNPESIVNLIENVVNKANIKLEDIDMIDVNEGPGSFTGLKVGASVANALSFSIQKKINEKKFGEIVKPTYE